MTSVRIAQPRQARSAKRRHDVLLAATRVFGRRGVAGSTMAEVATEAQVPVSAIYDYFEGKQHLLHEVPRANFEELYLGVEPLLARTRGGCDRIELLYVATLKYVSSNPDWGRVFFLEIWPSREAVRHEIRHAIDDYARRFLALIDQAKREGELKRGTNRYTSATVVLGSMCQLVATWLLFGRPKNLVTAGRATIRAVLNGVRR